MKQKIKKELKFYGRKVTTAFVMAIVFVAVTGTSIWALAVFTEPTDTPSNSVQDWAKNIMGANNSDNAFDSSSVIANRDGSIVERLEIIENQIQGPTAISAEQPAVNILSAKRYCYDLSATAEYATVDSNTSTTYTDWYLPTARELERFIGMSGDSSGLLTATQGRTSGDYHITRVLSNGNGGYVTYSANNTYRCVR